MPGNNRGVHNFYKQCFEYLLLQFLTKSNFKNCLKSPETGKTESYYFIYFWQKL
ncbi:hypothetical protein HMPREF0765_0791 [Sphingobacterium spiritivorum ATCC 33300]|uniref:Uncharacterized protein n=1 Tax=Sphingobacterium spiritivorum ATCC 33300 TaxID=525372 RepID=C2FU09_SPHSI|nr:hypothetical protein HMPREF0765_0791 [Sphingobacterium spiritivorum ATCC 33300]